MVFEPTFEEIGREADALPDLSGDEQEGDELDEIEAGDAPADDLPPLGA